jgi:hypothetical protein
LLIATAKLLEALYEAFPYARQAAIEELEREEAAVAEAFAGLQAAAHALGTDVAPQAASVAAHLAGVRAQLDVHLEVRS